MSIRKLHAYIGMLIAPTVLFLAATGILQIYSLHEAHGSYTPPALVAALSGIHKDQRFGEGHKDAPDAEQSHAASASEPAPEHEAAPERKPRSAHIATLLLKAFFTLVAVGLLFSTLFGVWMALQQSMRRRTHLVLLLIGTILPVVLAALTA